MRSRRSRSASTWPLTLILKYRRRWQATYSSSVTGSPSAGPPSAGRSAAVIGSASPTVWRTKTRVGGLELGVDLGRAQPQHVGPEQAHDVEPGQAPGGVGQRPLQEGRAEGGHQAVPAAPGAPAPALGVGVPPQLPEAPRPPRRLGVDLGRRARRGDQVPHVVEVRPGGILVEPLGGQEVGGEAAPPAPVGGLGHHRQVEEPCLGQGHRTEAEGQPQRHVAHEEPRLAQRQRQRGRPATRPRTPARCPWPARPRPGRWPGPAAGGCGRGAPTPGGGRRP